MPVATEQLPGRPTQGRRLRRPVVQESLSIYDQLLPGVLWVAARWWHGADAQHTFAPLGREPRLRCTTIWSWVRAGIPVLLLGNPRTGRLLKLLNLLKLSDTVGLPVLNLC
jgi:hypothetical protein